MKIALVFPNNAFTAPYLSYYLKVLNQQGIAYDLYTWNRLPIENPDALAYNQYAGALTGIKKILGYLGYRNFLIKKLKATTYEKVIVFTPQLGLFLQSFLSKNYQKRYWLDIRDFTTMLPKVPNKAKKLTQESAFTAISSEGFTTWLPRVGNYVMSHNVNSELIEKSLRQNSEKEFFTNEVLNIDTIGQIKDFTSDSAVVLQLGNNPGYSMHFIGFGPTAGALEAYAKEHQIANVHFLGRYNKEDESRLLANTDFLNILISRNDVNKGATLLSNRLYLSALYQIPSIVNQNTAQSEIVEKYKLGIIVNEYSELPDAIERYTSNFDKEAFVAGCKQFQQDVLADIANFDKKLIAFINK